jgi:hypothetical protein
MCEFVVSESFIGFICTNHFVGEGKGNRKAYQQAHDNAVSKFIAKKDSEFKKHELEF